jgi:hypothetical protein
VLSQGLTKTVPVSVQALARQHGVSTLDAITDAVATVATICYGVPFVRPTIEPTNTMALYGRRIPHVVSHVFLNLLLSLKKRTTRKSNWYAVTPLRVGGAHCGALDAGLFRRRCRFFFAYLSSESVTSLCDHEPEVRLATNPWTESLNDRLSSVNALVTPLSLSSLRRRILAFHLLICLRCCLASRQSGDGSATVSLVQPLMTMYAFVVSCLA